MGIAYVFPADLALWQLDGVGGTLHEIYKLISETRALSLRYYLRVINGHKIEIISHLHLLIWRWLS